MKIYFFIILILLTLYKIPLKKNIKLILIFLILTFIAGFRDSVGTDYNLYKNIFYNLNQINSVYSGDIEQGYIILNKVIYNLFPNHAMIFIITSGIIIGLFLKSILDYSINYSYSIILFIMLGYYHSSFNGIRQYIAISIFMYSLRYIWNKNIIPYTLCIIVSSMFHKSALILLPFYFYLNLNLNRKKYTIILIIFSAIGIFSDFIIYKLIPIISPYYFNKYINTIYLGNGLGGITNNIYILSFIVVIIVAIIQKNKIINIDKKSNVFLNLCIVSIPLMMLGTKSLLLFRVSLYFSIYFIFLIPVVFKSLNTKMKMCTYHILIAWIFFFYITTLLGRDGAIPYMNILLK